jgi:hypothetical protein
MPSEIRRPTEEELRSALHGGPELPSTLDADAVIRRARSHRLPRKIAFGSFAALAVAGVVLVGFTVVKIPQSALMSASDSAGGPESGEAPQSRDLQHEGPAAEKVNPCGDQLAPIAPNANGLELTTHFPEDAPANGQPVSGTVTLSNTGTARVIGSTAASPVITLSRDGTVLWHSNGAMITIAVLVDLAPGESMNYPVSLTPVACGAQDELGSGFRDNLPPLPAGDYRVSALIDFVPQSAAAGEHQFLGGPPQTLTLR